MILILQYAAGLTGVAVWASALWRRGRQFLDIGTGIPAAGNTHEVTQQAAAGRADRRPGQ
ncbi:MAG TPA: SAM-dependent methyltransferase [Streptosporangiaceae bacterium]|jgi:hypothetical protein|nr:SAM-dependent methyltransferase [Streptosporangiaceae bacterium]